MPFILIPILQEKLPLLQMNLIVQVSIYTLEWMYLLQSELERNVHEDLSYVQWKSKENKNLSM